MIHASDAHLIAQADTFWIWPILGSSLGLALFYRGFRTRQRKKLLTSTVRNAAPGPLELNGVAVGPYTLSAPLSGKQCYYYRAIAWELLRSGKSKEWKKIADESFRVPFYIEDDTGKLLVDPQDAEMDIVRAFHEEYPGLSTGGIPGQVATFLTHRGISGENKLKLEEYCIEANTPLFIAGTLAENNGPPISPKAIPTKPAPIASMTIPLPGSSQPGEKISVRSTPHIAMKSMSIEFEHAAESATSMSQQRETIYLSPETKAASSAREMTQQGKIAAALLRAGVSRTAGWAPGGVDKATALAVPVHDHTSDAQSPSFDLQPKVVLMKGARDSSFLISCHPQQKIANAMRWSSLACVWGGPTLVLLSVYVFLARLGWL